MLADIDALLGHTIADFCDALALLGRRPSIVAANEMLLDQAMATLVELRASHEQEAVTTSEIQGAITVLSRCTAALRMDLAAGKPAVPQIQ